eukprot:symbB.v1.2.003199.t2/scaffold166.1/size289592/1
MASAVEERPKKRIRISYNDTSETFAIAESVPPEHNLSTIASVFNLSSVGLKVVDNQSSNVALTYDGLDANAEYKISTATPLQAPQSDEGMTSFFKALRDAKEIDVNGQKVLTLDIQKHWDFKKLQLQNARGAPHFTFLLRQEYGTLLEKIGTDDENKFGAILVGTSGIGKSAFRFYMMRRWLNNDDKLPKKRFSKVLFNLGVAFYEMDASGTVSPMPKVDVFHHLPQDRLALLDPCQQIAGLDKSLHFNFMLVTTSASPLSGQETKTGNYKELQKALIQHQLGTVLVMHVWSYDEIKAVAPDASDELIRNFGCVPRWCLRDDLTTEEKMKTAVKSSLIELDKQNALFEFMQMSVAKPDELLRDRRLQYQLMKIDGTGQAWGTKGFISKFVAECFLRNAFEICQKEHAKIAQMMKNPFSMQAFGHIFEEWAYQHLAKGQTCTFDSNEMKGSFKSSGTFERDEAKTQTSMKPKIECGALLKAPMNYGSIDMFGLIEAEDTGKWQLLMFQETVGQKHREAQWNDIKSIVGACQQIAKEKKKELECLLIYLVPKDSYAQFKCPECKALKENHISISKGYFNIDMPDELTGLKTWEEALKP